MNLNEIFNTKVPVNQWVHHENIETGTFFIDDEEFNIIIEKLDYTFQDKRIDFINVAFAKIVDGVQSRELTKLNKNTNRILGAVYNSIITKIREYHNISAVVFVARDNVAARMSLYNKMASSILNPFTSIIPNVLLPGKDGARMTILLDGSLDKNLINAFKLHLTQIEQTKITP